MDDCANLVEVYNLASSVNFSSDNLEYAELSWQYIVDTYGGYFQIFSKNVYTSADVESVLITQGDYVFYKDGGDYYLAAYTGWDSDIVLPELTVDGKAVNYGISDYALSAGYYYYLKSVFLDNYISESNIINSNMLNVKSIVIPDCVTSVGNYAFAHNYLLENITMGSGITSIGNFAFVYCFALESIAIPESVTAIGYDAFEGVTAEIAWGSNPSITEIADGVFAYYQGTSITIPSSVTSIGSWAFSGCENLTTITIPESVTYIGISAFLNCTSLEDIIFANTSGWRVTVSKTDTDGTEVDVTDSSLNATYMTDNYGQYYWYRSEN